MNKNLATFMGRTNKIVSSVSGVSRFSNLTGDEPSVFKASSLNQFSRTLTFVISNASNVAGTFVVLGQNKFGDGANAGSDAFITVQLKQTSHSQAKRSIDSQPTQLSGCKYSSAGSAIGVDGNFANAISYFREPFTGGGKFDEVTPDTYREPENLTQTLVRIPDFNGMDLDGDTYLTGQIEAGTTITLILTIGSKVQLGNANANMAVVTSTDVPNPSGTKPIQMVIAAAPGK